MEYFSLFRLRHYATFSSCYEETRKQRRKNHEKSIETCRITFIDSDDRLRRSIRVQQDSPSETADPLVKALASGKESSLALNGKANHTYTFQSPVVENNENTISSTVSTNITVDAWPLSILDEGEGKTTETYFKDANGLLAEEYLKADNAVGLPPILTYGSTTNYDKEFANPFLLLEASDFVKEEDGYHVKGIKPANFVYRIFNESFGAAGELVFTMEEDHYTGVKRTGFMVDDFIYTSDDTIKRHVTLDFALTYSTDAVIEHLAPEADKSNVELTTLFDSAKSKKFRISNESSDGNYGFETSFDGTSIFATFNVGGEALDDIDMPLKPDADGLLQFQYYDKSSKPRIDNDFSETEMYNHPTTYDVLRLDIGSVSTDIFDIDIKKDIYAPVDAALAMVDDNFISMLYEYLNLSAMECFRSHLTTFKLSNICEDSFKIHVASVTSGNGFTLKAESHLKVDQIGTSKLPFDL